MSSTSEYKRRTMDNTFGSGSPEEWSQRIQNLQKQVDEDGLQEQQRLEAEIARSRMERAKRRSTLATPTRIDPASVSQLSTALDDSHRDTDRQSALRRLTGETDVAERERESREPASSSSGTAPTGAKAVSLAEFMGGRATGPRLNRHAPQADTEEFVREYEERKRNASSAPLLQRVAPPFALPGLAKDSPKSSEAPKDIKQPGVPSVSSLSTQPRSASIQPSSSPQAEAEEPSRTSMLSSSISAGYISPKASEQAARSSTPVKTLSPVSSPPANPVTARWTAAVNTTPTKSSSVSSSPPSNSQPRMNMLARPLSQPATPPVQQFIPATNPSPAFLKPPPPKEERPSITRLQGRGFVERQVKASAKLSTTIEETPKPVRVSGEKNKVLQRWPGEGGASGAIPERREDIPKREFARSLPANPVVRAHEPVPSINTPLSIKSVKERTKEFDKTPVKLPGIGGAGPPSKLVRPPVGSQDSIVANPGAVPRRLPGLAADSATSSAMKKPSSSTSLLREVTRRRSVHFDDLDKPNDDETPAIAGGHQTDVSNSKKLTHLTKDRVRKPRKGREPAIVSQTHVEDEEKHTQSEPVGSNVVQNPPSVDRPTTIAPAEVMIPRSSPSVKSPTQNLWSAASDSERSSRSRQPPPLIAPKPMALRRNSQQSPAEQSPAATPSEQSSAFRTRSAPPPSNSIASSPPPGRITSSPDSELVQRGSVRSAILNWGQEQQTKPTTERSSSLLEEVTQVKDQARSDPLPTQEEMETQEHQPTVPPVLNPPTLPLPQPRPRPLSQSSERRRSITQRYSSIMLPALKEEKTPVPTPEGSLKIAPNGPGNVAPSVQDIHQSLMKTVDKEETSKLEILQIPDTKEDLSKARASGKSPVSPQDSLVHITDDPNPPIPTFSLSRLLAPLPGSAKGSLGDVISIEAFLISGTSSTAIKDSIHVVYDQEILAFVSRKKNRTSGLVATTVWAWVGSRASCGEKEEGKLQEVASRFNTTLIKVPQGKEPFDLVQILGGIIAIRHGARSRWSKENTALHCVRTHGSNCITIEEVELVSRNVCSAFTFCLSVLDAVIIWHGRGALLAEREAAKTYAGTLVSEGIVPTEMEEGRDDEMFWAMMDDAGYANADYWKFRDQSQLFVPRLWNIANDALHPVVPFSATDLREDAIYMYDGVFELFVIVCQGARGRRQDIRLALAAAESVAAASAVTRFFPPPVHVLILPTRIPLDLRAGFRLMDLRDSEEALNPDHINLLTLAEAQEQLGRRQWSARKLRDPQFLPLGISPDMIPK
ncbi:SubName: Full=Related to glycinamide ribonucleotide transformylase {ECO:0000313/EMBL:CCA70449.1} [Serendipita indica DSM 11827]|uniref:Related to glycinamide ribonucleotide transformylase n=1 Tax=Serendipita indica (strain DSM 11827) TaxID=1109443 RepID=G4TGL6_SERID|nr:SubName: Full=Related to glycinamide ribonucleotide transformylase {ECO:0000313/EMBL:CCA70449.1} [Serendipita indica DSM 11827]CCA70449.1 related to glycinamide ribonucleotide transformylase [Serendipita indica DSM 11827]